MFTNAEEETTVQESTELTTEQRRWAGTESPARSVCLGLKVPSKLNWVPGTRPSFLFLSPAPVYFHYQYQIFIAGPCGISLQGIASQRDPISPHPWSPPRIEWPSPGCRAPRWSPSCPASLEVSGLEVAERPAKIDPLFFQQGGGREGGGGLTASPESIWCSSVRSIEQLHPNAAAVGVQVSEKTRNSDGPRGGGDVQLGAS